MRHSHHRKTRPHYGTYTVLCILIFVLGSFLLPKITQRSEMKEQTDWHVRWINQRADYAKTMHQQYGVLPSINLAQAIIESEWGKSTLAEKYHNYYGIKAGPNEPSVALATKEYQNGQWQTVTANFAVYNSWENGMAAHTRLLVSGTTWNPNQYAAVLKAGDYKQAAQALVDAGYATDPTYAAKIVDVIEHWHLQQFDQ